MTNQPDLAGLDTPTRRFVAAFIHTWSLGHGADSFIDSFVADWVDPDVALDQPLTPTAARNRRIPTVRPHRLHHRPGLALHRHERPTDPLRRRPRPPLLRHGRWPLNRMEGTRHHHPARRQTAAPTRRTRHAPHRRRHRKEPPHHGRSAPSKRTHPHRTNCGPRRTRHRRRCGRRYGRRCLSAHPRYRCSSMTKPSHQVKRTNASTNHRAHTDEDTTA